MYETPGIGGPSIDKMKTFFGFITADFIPPRDLFHPVLLKNDDGFILNSLHPVRNKTVTSAEAQLAMSKGYVILNVRALHEFTPSSTIFTDYMRNFMRLKIESENYLDNGVPNEEKIAEVCRMYWEAFQIELRPGIMRKGPNPTLRQVAKLILNCLWGRLGMRLDRPKDMYVRPTWSSAPDPTTRIASRSRKVPHLCPMAVPTSNTRAASKQTVPSCPDSG